MRSTQVSGSGRLIGVTKSSDGISRKFEVTDTVEALEGPEKRVVLQLLLFYDRRVQLRFGYYKLGKKGDMKGKWIWARNTPLMDLPLFNALIAQAKAKGWPINGADS